MRCPQRRRSGGYANINTTCARSHADSPPGSSGRTPQVQAEGDRQTALGDAEALAQYKAELHGSCDFLLKPAGTPAT